MTCRQSNNEFFSYQGCISRKNYTINMFILAALYICLSLVRFENFAQFISFKFIFYVLMFMVSLFKLVILMSALSVIYRRIEDISSGRSYKLNTNMKRLFVLLFVFPVLYMFCLRYFFDIIPFLINLLDFAIIFILMPLGFLTSLILCFIKGK